MTRIERKTLAERIAAEIREQILQGRIAPGERLPPERKLAETYQTNRNTLREAVRVLEMQGLLRVRHGSGAVVKDFRTEGHLTLLPFVLAEMENPGERARELDDVMLFRRAALAEMAGRAAERSDDEDIAVLRSRLRAIESAPQDDLVECIRRDLAFYRAIAEGAHSHVVRWIFETFARMYEQAMEVIALLWVYPEGYLSSLAGVVESIAAHDAEEARSRMVRHHDAADQTVRDVIDSFQ